MPRFFFRENGLWTALVGLAVVAGCANPVPPSGGPRDQTPPRIATSRPAAEATDVSRGRTVRIAFSEYVDRESLREALTVTPAPGGRLTFDWSRRSVEITFPERFRDNTTYLLTIDKALTDLRNVELEQPITLAFSTGAQIDQGRLAGRVVGNRRGQGREGVDVYAYAAAAADSVRLPGAPLYRTQTGPEGTFQFEYLSEKQRYYVVALRDRNRNYRGGPLEAFAVPPRPALEARRGDSTAAAAPAAAAISAPPDSAARDTVSQSALVQDAGARDRTAPAGDGEERTNERSGEAPWIIGKRDRVPPRLTGALPISSRRVALRFSEPVRLRARQARRVALTDTTAAEGGEDASAVAVRTLYRRPDQEQRLALRTDSIRPAGHRVRLVPPGEEAPDDSLGRGWGAPVAVDTSGNAPERPAEATFTAADRPDTLKLRFRGFRKSGPPLPTTSGDGRALALAPGQAPAVQFNQPPAVGTPSVSDTAAAAALVTARDTATGAALPFRLDTDDGTTYRLAFDPPLAPDQVARLRVNARRFRAPLDTAYARLARRLPSDVLGGVSGAVSVTRDSAVTDSVMGDSVAAAVLVELYAAGEDGSAGAGSEPLRTTRVDSSGGFVFRGLPEAPYRFRAFLDRDGDGEWDVGRLAPYRRAEPLAWSRRPVEARPRWETATEDTLRIRASRSADGE
jgi:hypothetical protein